jgi:hypothetical protein
MTAIGFVLFVLFRWGASVAIEGGYDTPAYYAAGGMLVGAAVCLIGIAIKLWEVMP